LDNLLGILEGAREAICALMAERDYQRALAAVREWAARPEAAFWYGISYAEGVKP
jgi:hypothetical protein